MVATPESGWTHGQKMEGRLFSIVLAVHKKWMLGYDAVGQLCKSQNYKA